MRFPSRRTLLKTAVALPMISVGAVEVFAAEPKIPTKVVDIVKGATVIDMLAPLSMHFEPEGYAHELSPADKEMFRQSGTTAFHHSAGVGPYDAVMQFLLGWAGFVGRNSDLFVLVDKVQDIDHAKSIGKIAVILGQQDADHFRRPSDVKAFYQFGQRCSQLTYNSQNLLGSGSTERVDGGVSDYGVRIIEEMNKTGMLVDVSHSGDRTTLDAIELSAKPIAITHSNCRALNNHPRLKTDEAIKKLAAKGGVMGISGVRMFVKAEEPTTIENIVDHVDHVAKLVGIEHVGVGSDSDLRGYDAMPEEWRNQLKAGYKSSYAFRDKIDTDGYNTPMRIYNLTDTLLRRGYNAADIQKILGGNFRRLLGEIWV